ncbi:MAG: hypothetical protein J6Q22_03040 [Prevotella sp.]|nr:hypothetical protein [Prevotella sp.]
MIPPFDHNNVLPPYINDQPAVPGAQSPYECEILELCQRFATSPDRRSILKGFIQFRLDCLANNIKGFQWIDGSFVENIEAVEARAPHDIDVVSFIVLRDSAEESRIVANFPEFANFYLSKAKYCVDHYPLVINADPLWTVHYTKYWNMLFSHNRRGVWKGMLQVPLYDSADKDNEALTYLNSL